jgi:hypothetical protein
MQHTVTVLSTNDKCIRIKENTGDSVKAFPVIVPHIYMLCFNTQSSLISSPRKSVSAQYSIKADHGRK